MVKKIKKSGKKVEKKLSKAKKVKKEEKNSEDEGGLSVDDAFADDEDVEYAASKPRKIKGKKMSEKEMEEELDEVEEEEEKMSAAVNNGIEQKDVSVKASKPVSKLKKGDKIWVDGNEYTIDQHYVLIEHPKTKEMAIECFDPKTEKDYQIRYFNDQVESTIEFYELQEIMFIKKRITKVEW